VGQKIIKKVSSTNLLLLLVLFLSCSINSKSISTDYSSRQKGFYYRTKKGDTIYSISKEYNMDYRDILKANSLDVHTKILPGQLIFLPISEKGNTSLYGEPKKIGVTRSIQETRKIPEYHIVKKNETLASISKLYDIELTELMKRNKQIVPEKLRVGEKIHLTQVTQETKRVPEKKVVANVQSSPTISGRKYHIVRKGETLSHIANLYGIGLQTLLQFNRSVDVRKLRIGQKIYIPTFSNSIRTNVYTERVSESTQRIVGKKGDFLWPLPVNGQFSRGFVPSGRNQHKGIDVCVPQGTRILAAQSGRVIYCGNEIKSYGNLIIIDHSNGITTVYAHLKRILVIKNQMVRKGNEIGTVGNTGRATGNHLHFEIRIDGEAVNPLQYL